MPILRYIAAFLVTANAVAATLHPHLVQAAINKTVQELVVTGDHQLVATFKFPSYYKSTIIAVCYSGISSSNVLSISDSRNGTPTGNNYFLVSTAKLPAVNLGGAVGFLSKVWAATNQQKDLIDHNDSLSITCTHRADWAVLTIFEYQNLYPWDIYEAKLDPNDPTTWTPAAQGKALTILPQIFVDDLTGQPTDVGLSLPGAWSASTMYCTNTQPVPSDVLSLTVWNDAGTMTLLGDATNDNPLVPSQSIDADYAGMDDGLGGNTLARGCWYQDALSRCASMSDGGIRSTLGAVTTYIPPHADPSVDLEDLSRILSSTALWTQRVTWYASENTTLFDASFGPMLCFNSQIAPAEVILAPRFRVRGIPLR